MTSQKTAAKETKQENEDKRRPENDDPLSRYMTSAYSFSILLDLHRHIRCLNPKHGKYPDFLIENQTH